MILDRPQENLASASGVFPRNSLQPAVDPVYVLFGEDRNGAAQSTQDERHVPESEKKAIYEAYGIEECKAHCSGKGGCEIDHLLCLELGGANTSDNLWPQPYDGEWNAIDKDRLEKRMHSLICTKKTLKLKDAQKEIAEDWVAAYKKYVGARKTSHPKQRCGL